MASAVSLHERSASGSDAEGDVLLVQPVVIDHSHHSASRAPAMVRDQLQDREAAEPRRPHVLTWRWQHPATGKDCAGARKACMCARVAYACLCGSPWGKEGGRESEHMRSACLSAVDSGQLMRHMSISCYLMLCRQGTCDDLHHLSLVQACRGGHRQPACPHQAPPLLGAGVPRHGPCMPQIKHSRVLAKLAPDLQLASTCCLSAAHPVFR